MGFPVSPQLAPGDTYSSDNRLWSYDGYGWRFLGASGSVDITLSGTIQYEVGITAPISPTTGDKWFHISDAVEYTFIQDIDQTSHWIEIGYGCPTLGGSEYGLTGINFPNTECIGDSYSYDSRIWIFTGYAWKMVCQNTTDPEFTFGLTAPDNPRVGHRWVDSSNGFMYTFVNDYEPLGQTGQWVSFGNGSEIIGPIGVTGDTGPIGPTGPVGPTGAEYVYELADVTIDPEVDYGPDGDGKVLRFDYATSKWVMADLLGSMEETFVNSINGCCGSVGIIGTANEIEVSNSCPNIIIGLPNNVSVSGNLTVSGNYNGYLDGGIF